jgi:hypothetical protein
LEIYTIPLSDLLVTKASTSRQKHHLKLLKQKENPMKSTVQSGLYEDPKAQL